VAALATLPPMPASARPLLALSIAALATVALLPGCGGGGGDAGDLTKAEVIAKGNEICRQGDRQYTELQKNPPKTSEEAATLTQKLIAITNSEVDQIGALNAPEEVRPALDRYLKARQSGLAVLEQGLKAAENNDARTYAAAQAKMAAGQVDRLKLAQAVGFTDCSRPGGSSSGG
jgi:hypothetical protein